MNKNHVRLAVIALALLCVAATTIIVPGPVLDSRQFKGGTGETNVTARPSSDINTTGWTASTGPGLWEDLDGVVGSDDSLYINNATPADTEVWSGNATATLDPLASTAHILRVRYQKFAATGANYDFVVEIRENYVSEASPGTFITNVIATAISATTISTMTTTLQATQADLISDYGNLDFRAWAAKNGGGANRECRFMDIEFEVEVP